MPHRPLRIVVVASEVVPYAKTGGLADVAGALPDALARRGHDVHVVMPLYGQVDRARHGVAPAGPSVEAALPGRTESLAVHATQRPSGAHVWFLAHPLFERSGLYGDRHGEFGDNHVRFALLSRGALDLVRRRLPRPDVVHLHDWQTGLGALELKAPDRPLPDELQGARVVFTLHNLGYTGSIDGGALDDIGVSRAHFHMHALEFHGRASLLKAGLVFADALTTVSPRYAREIQTATFGHGLEGLLRHRAPRLVGILNGIDTAEWDPATDRHLPARYDAHHLGGKAACKAALQRELGLDEDAQAPLYGVVSRLAWQKGVDLVAEIAEGLVRQGGQLAVLGTGEEGVERWLQEAAARFPNRVAVRLAFDDGLAHRIVAGSDVFLMPSRYEPCGLTQMYALRYGTVPVVRAVGGLDDTVEELDGARGEGTGFKFGAATASALWAAVQRADEARRRPDVWNALVARGMVRDFSWDASAEAYERLFDVLVASPHEAALAGALGA